MILRRARLFRWPKLNGFWVLGRGAARRSARLPAAPSANAQQLASSNAAASNASRNHGDRGISEVSSTSTNQCAGTNEFASPSKAE
jgi:hypothetical protein